MPGYPARRQVEQVRRRAEISVSRICGGSGSNSHRGRRESVMTIAPCRRARFQYSRRCVRLRSAVDATALHRRHQRDSVATTGNVARRALPDASPPLILLSGPREFLLRSPCRNRRNSGALAKVAWACERGARRSKAPSANEVPHSQVALSCASVPQVSHFTAKPGETTLTPSGAEGLIAFHGHPCSSVRRCKPLSPNGERLLRPQDGTGRLGRLAVQRVGR